MDCGETEVLIQVAVLSRLLVETLERMSDYSGSDEFLGELRELSEWAQVELEVRRRP